MQAIKTKYLPATNIKGSRIKASCEAGSVIIPYNYSLSSAELHRFAAFKLLHKLSWNPTHVHTSELNDYYVHVLEFRKPEDTTNLPEFLKPQT
jgi:hypothetical protein